MALKGSSFLSFLAFLLITQGAFSQNQPLFPQPGTGLQTGSSQQPVFPQPGKNQQPVFPQPGGQQPVFPQPGGNQKPVFPQPGYQKPVFPQPGDNQQPVFPQQGGQQPVFPQPGGSGSPQPVFPQPGGQQPVFPQPGDNQQPVFPQQGGQQPVFPQPGGGSQQPISTPADQQYVTTPKCPEGNDKVYPAPDGGFFKLQCSTHGWFGTLLTTTANTYQHCIDTCSETDGCLAINWDSVNGARPNSKVCVLMKSDNVGDKPCRDHDFAYAVPPPTIPQTTELVPQCTTECPGANHRQYTGPTGQVFKMNCGKRHGADYLFTLDKSSLKECMDACSELVPCNSVDYHARSKKCYLSNHQGEPIIDAPGFNSAYSIGCAGACEDKSCGCKNA